LAKGRDVWVTERPAPTIVSTRRSDQGIIVGRQLPEGEGRNVGGKGWVDTRPATTVNGDPRISEPGHHDANVSGSQQANAVRVSLAEALVLQSFPADYPVRGTKTKQYEQVGNAIPPLLAWHVLRAGSTREAAGHEAEA
jgi:DNA (cytosine-5)-methyltransferase 1